VNPSQAGFHLIKRERLQIPFTPERKKKKKCDFLKPQASPGLFDSRLSD